MSKTIVITGGTGLVGTRLTQLMLEKGWQVRVLVREARQIPKVKTFLWDISSQTIDPAALQQVDAIVHLAGAGIADERWTEARKKEIISSRTDSARLLYNALPNPEKRPPLSDVPGQAATSPAAIGERQRLVFVSASAIGIYGGDSGASVMTEDSPKGTDFLAQVCKVWEASADEFEKKNVRTVHLRIGIVLSDKGGALPKLVQPIRLGAGAALGSGKQVMSWIHIDDLCRMFIYAIENQALTGAYNAVAPHPVSNETLTHQAAGVLKKWVLPIHVPAFTLRLAFGEMVSAVLSNNTVSCEKVSRTGFTYLFTESQKALEDLL